MYQYCFMKVADADKILNSIQAALEEYSLAAQSTVQIDNDGVIIGTDTAQEENASIISKEEEDEQEDGEVIDDKEKIFVDEKEVEEVKEESLKESDKDNDNEKSAENWIDVNKLAGLESVASADSDGEKDVDFDENEAGVTGEPASLGPTEDSGSGEVNREDFGERNVVDKQDEEINKTTGEEVSEDEKEEIQVSKEEKFPHDSEKDIAEKPKEEVRDDTEKDYSNKNTIPLSSNDELNDLGLHNEMLEPNQNDDVDATSSRLARLHSEGEAEISVSDESEESSKSDENFNVDKDVRIVFPRVPWHAL